MDRREVLKSLGAALSLPVIQKLEWTEALALGREVHARLETVTGETHYIFKTLDPLQNDMVTEIAELIIPETDTPGARAARVNEFIDLMLTDWFRTEDRERFLVGLARLDRRCHEAMDKRFLDCDETQRTELLKELEAEALGSRDKTGWTSLTDPEQPFFQVMKALTLFGYYTSEVGMKVELAPEESPSSYSGCIGMKADA
jgi:hypothetical protein